MIIWLPPQVSSVHVVYEWSLLPLLLKWLILVFVTPTFFWFIFLVMSFDHLSFCVQSVLFEHLCYLVFSFFWVLWRFSFSCLIFFVITRFRYFSPQIKFCGWGFEVDFILNTKIDEKRRSSMEVESMSILDYKNIFIVKNVCKFLNLV